MTDDTRVDSQAIDCRNRRMALHMRVAALIVFIAVAVTAAPPSPLHGAMERVQSAAAGTDHAAFTGAPGEAERVVSAGPAGRGREAGQTSPPPPGRPAPPGRYPQESSPSRV